MKPKFRAWNEKTESFINYGDLMLDLKNGKVYAGDVGIPEYTIDVTNQVILMQSTGLKDKNGKEIYEGDIVQMQWTTYDEPELFYIRTIEGRAPRVDNRIKGKELWLVHQDCKVVGNIYQNRELLEVVE